MDKNFSNKLVIATRRQALSSAICLTVGEWYQVKRWRSGLTVKQMSTQLGMSPATYRRLEQIKERVTRGARNLSYGEMCKVLRLRAGKTQAEIANKTGMSRYWLIQLEDDKTGDMNISKLASFWGLL